MRALLALAFLLALAPHAAAHGALAVNEAETHALADFEGMHEEGAFPHGGYTIWDVYVGEAYNRTLGEDGVYFKMNLGGVGTEPSAPPAPWRVIVSFTLDGEAFTRSFERSAGAFTTDFDEFEWMVADENVLQVRAWLALPDAVGKTLADLVVESRVGEDLRDVAPGGVGAGPQVVPVPGSEAQGRVVDSIVLGGPGRFFSAAAASEPNDHFRLEVVNLLAEQGQHFYVYPASGEGWSTVVTTPSANVKGGANGTLGVILRAGGTPGAVVPPLPVDVVSDIGGRVTLHAFLGPDGLVRLVADRAQAADGILPPAAAETPLPALLGLVALAGAVLRRR